MFFESVDTVVAVGGVLGRQEQEAFYQGAFTGCGRGPG